MSRKYEVDGVLIYPDGREVCLENKRGGEIYKARRHVMWVRQEYKCAMCNKRINSEAATFDHQRCRGNSGAFRDDRIWKDGEWLNAALCVICQGIKGSKRYAWIDGTYQPVSRAA